MATKREFHLAIAEMQSVVAKAARKAEHDITRERLYEAMIDRLTENTRLAGRVLSGEEVL